MYKNLSSDSRTELKKKNNTGESMCSHRDSWMKGRDRQIPGVFAENPGQPTRDPVPNKGGKCLMAS